MGKLIDAYRFLHKEKDMERGFSWSGNPIGKYRGKRMRIDYFIAAEQLKDRIVSREMHGQGMNYKVCQLRCRRTTLDFYIIKSCISMIVEIVFLSCYMLN